MRVLPACRDHGTTSDAEHPSWQRAESGPAPTFREEATTGPATARPRDSFQLLPGRVLQPDEPLLTTAAAAKLERQLRATNVDGGRGAGTEVSPLDRLVRARPPVVGASSRQAPCAANGFTCFHSSKAAWLTAAWPPSRTRSGILISRTCVAASPRLLVRWRNASLASVDAPRRSSQNVDRHPLRPVRVAHLDVVAGHSHSPPSRVQRQPLRRRFRGGPAA